MRMTGEILTVGRSFSSQATFSIAASVSMPPTTRPKIVCLPSRWVHWRNVMKLQMSNEAQQPTTNNCDLFVFLPWLAIDSTPRVSCFSARTISSLNAPPNALSPPSPLPVGSPPWICRYIRCHCFHH